MEQCSQELQLGRAFQPLFEAGPLDDRLGIAEAKAGAEGAVLVPELLEAGVEPLELRSRLGVVLVREEAVELGAAVARALDLVVDLLEVHARFNARQRLDIPLPPGAEQDPENDRQADDSGGHGERHERLVDHSYPRSVSRSSSIPK